MVQRPRRFAHGPVGLTLDEIKSPVPGCPHWQTRALFVLEPDFSRVRLKRLTIEPADYPNAPAPPGDEPQTITAQLLRAVKLRDIESVSHAFFAALSPSPAAAALAQGADHRTPGRKQDTWDDVTLATLSAEYAELIQNGESAIIPKLAERWGKSRSAIATAIKHARNPQRALLTPAPSKGVAGGRITGKAKRILVEAKRRKR